MLTPQFEPTTPHGGADAAPVLPLQFCMQASLLFRNQDRLKFSPGGFPVLLQLVEHWWAVGCRPFREPELAARPGLGERQLRRHLTELERRGLLTRDDRRAGRQPLYDLGGPVQRLGRDGLEARTAH
jgi:hypothetical protein